jgi:uncharacterized protein (DUF486 family)
MELTLTQLRLCSGNTPFSSWHEMTQALQLKHLAESITMAYFALMSFLFMHNLGMAASLYV